MNAAQDGEIRHEWLDATVLRMTLSGAFTGAAMRRALTPIGAALEGRVGASLPVDGSEAHVKDAEVLSVVGQFFKQARLRKLAVVGIKGPKAIFFTVLLKALGPNYPAKSFRTQADGLAWLAQA